MEIWLGMWICFLMQLKQPVVFSYLWQHARRQLYISNPKKNRVFMKKFIFLGEMYKRILMFKCCMLCVSYLVCKNMMKLIRQFLSQVHAVFT